MKKYVFQLLNSSEIIADDIALVESYNHYVVSGNIKINGILKKYIKELVIQKSSIVYHYLEETES